MHVREAEIRDDDSEGSYNSMENLLELSLMESYSELSENPPERVIPGYKKPEIIEDTERIDSEYYKKLIISNTSLAQRKSIYQSGTRQSSPPQAEEIVYVLDSKFLSKYQMAKQLFQSRLCNDINDECISILVQNCEEIFLFNTFIRTK